MVCHCILGLSNTLDLLHFTIFACWKISPPVYLSISLSLSVCFDQQNSFLILSLPRNIIWASSFSTMHEMFSICHKYVYISLDSYTFESMMGFKQNHNDLQHFFQLYSKMAIVFVCVCVYVCFVCIQVHSTTLTFHFVCIFCQFSFTVEPFLLWCFLFFSITNTFFFFSVEEQT